MHLFEKKVMKNPKLGRLEKWVKVPKAAIEYTNQKWIGLHSKNAIHNMKKMVQYKVREKYMKNEKWRRDVMK